jgi:hypothetical protein
MGYPGGGGMGRMGGMGYPGGMGRRGGMQQPGPQVAVTIRWESSAPVRQARLKMAGANGQEDQKEAELYKKDYVISVVGLTIPANRRRNMDDDNDPNNPNGSGGSQQNTNLQNRREELMATSRLSFKEKDRAAISPEDVKIDAMNNIRFYFPRTEPISLDDKEVTFQTQVGSMKVERKFNIKDMKFQGKLEL